MTQPPPPSLPPKPSKPVTITLALGGAFALLGLIAFGSAHELSLVGHANGYVSETQRMNEVLWSVLGIAVIFAGLLIVAVALHAWCRENRP